MSSPIIIATNTMLNYFSRFTAQRDNHRTSQIVYFEIVENLKEYRMNILTKNGMRFQLNVLIHSVDNFKQYSMYICFCEYTEYISATFPFIEDDVKYTNNNILYSFKRVMGSYFNGLCINKIESKYEFNTETMTIYIGNLEFQLIKFEMPNVNCYNGENYIHIIYRNSKEDSFKIVKTYFNYTGDNLENILVKSDVYMDKSIYASMKVLFSSITGDIFPIDEILPTKKETGYVCLFINNYIAFCLTCTNTGSDVQLTYIIKYNGNIGIVKHPDFPNGKTPEEVFKEIENKN